MSISEQNPPATPVVGPTASRMSLRTKVVVALCAVGVGVGGVAIAQSAFAASPTPTPDPLKSSDSVPDGSRPDGPGGPGGFGGHGDRGGMGPGMRGALHGAFVIAKPGGGFQTIATQRGTVKALSSTSITVVSQDKFTQTYVVTANTNVNAARDGIGSVTVGESVGVMATVSGSTSTAVEIRDKSDLDKNRKQFAPPAPAGSGPTA